jgi:septal ring factor EnvC (AmiA/AmiB activator)
LNIDKRRKNVENKKIGLSFGIVVIAFLVVFYILFKDFNNSRVNDFKDYIANITSIVKQKNNKIRILAYQLAVEQKENEDLRNTLADTRNDLDSISKKIAQQVPVAVPATATK